MEISPLKKKSKYYEEDQSIYSEKSRDSLLEDDELSPEEEAFMRGYQEAM